MLKKLLKYDIKYIYKVLIVFYILSIFFGGLTRLVSLMESSTMRTIIYGILNGVTISMLFSVIINTIMRSWARFTNNIYKDEAYLTHTLPVDRKILFNSKILSIIITLFTSVLILAITIFIAYYSKENITLLRNTFSMIENIYSINMTLVITFVLIIFFLEILSMVESGYVGIILGHRKNDKRIMYSVLFGFLVYIISQILIIIFIYILGLFDSNIMLLFTSNSSIKSNTLNIIMIITTILYLIINTILYIICQKTFNKGINVD